MKTGSSADVDKPARRDRALEVGQGHETFITIPYVR